MKRKPQTIKLPPMAAERRDEIMLRLHLLIDAVLHQPCHETINSFSKELAIVTGALAALLHVPLKQRTDPPSVAICAAIDALHDIERRRNEIGRWGCSGDNIHALRGAVVAFDEITKWLPWPAYVASAVAVKAQCEGAAS